MNINDIHIDAEVYWNDPDNGECSGYYKVVDILSDEIVVICPLNSYGRTEVFISELS
jgi:hypothetical protein